MQYRNIISLAALASTAFAAPAPTTGNIVFKGAANAQYSLTVTLDNVDRPTYNVLSISSVSSDSIDVKAQCTLTAVDRPPVLVEGPKGTWQVGPPQTIKSIKCSPAGSPPASISIEFQGANPSEGAKYTVTVPLNESKVPTNNVLSISTLVSSFGELATKCTFDYVDGMAALSRLNPTTWAVGPPQTIKAVSCKA
ncbi:hypothetical protein BJ875DRAFT_153211 [Amylocarpus encephaloides]|uniref:Ubiquitin 3 binding protein But2 C-terminal domain-containing protein n=1 Tax=Amylocarpus encephaloides TaxID=45428 RepID=A0A9P8C235_9HELO|nr:hypothetical protein BJ875DRAFT_153211 [Amylocarpus encephaloides]